MSFQKGIIPWNKGKKTVPVGVCPVCKSEFYAYKNFTTGKRKQFCSRRCSKTGEYNAYWKGDNVGYAGVHGWIKKQFPKTKLCQECSVQPPFDLANISQEYKRDFSDWEWLCRKCHMTKDGRLEKAKTTAFKRGNVPWISGRTHSIETKIKLSNKGKSLWQNPEYRSHMVVVHTKEKP